MNWFSDLVGAAMLGYTVIKSIISPLYFPDRSVKPHIDNVHRVSHPPMNFDGGVYTTDSPCLSRTQQPNTRSLEALDIRMTRHR